MLDALALIYKGANQSFTLLQAMPLDSFQFENDQFGGDGKGTFTAYGTFEDSTNYLGNNRLDCFLRLDLASTSVNAGDNSITVENSERWAKELAKSKYPPLCAIYDGQNYDVFTFTDLITSTGSIVINSSPVNSYGPGASLLVQRYRGYISKRTRDASLNNLQIIETAGYQSLLTQAYLTSVQLTLVECGYAIYHLLALKNPILEINQQTENFVMCMTDTFPSSAFGTPEAGTSQYYSGTLSESSLSDTIKEIMVIANSNATNTTYAFYYDHQSNVFFEPLNNTTPTVSVNLAYATPGYSSDGIFSVIDAYQAADYDMSTVQNVIIISGGSDPVTSQPITQIFTDSDSISAFGQREATVSNVSLTTAAMVSAFGLNQINQTALPLVTQNMNFQVSGDFCTAQDYIEVNGFTDGSSQSFNVQSVVTKWSADQFGQFQQTIIGSQLYPDERTIMAQIAAQAYRAAAGPAQPSTKITDRYVQYGLGATIDATLPETLDLQAGALVCNVVPSQPSNLTTFNIAAEQFTATSDGVWTLAFLYRNANGSTYYEAN